MLSVKQGGIKYHFLSLWYDLTWDCEATLLIYIQFMNTVQIKVLFKITESNSQSPEEDQRMYKWDQNNKDDINCTYILSY